MNTQQEASTSTDQLVEITIVVNGRRRTVHHDSVSFEEIVKIAYPEQHATAYTVAYSSGPVGQEEGNMSKGDRVKIQNEMTFDVYPTNQS